MIYLLSWKRRCRGVITNTFNCKEGCEYTSETIAVPDTEWGSWQLNFPSIYPGDQRSKYLICYYPITEHDILIQSVGTNNKLKITLSASLVWQLITSLNLSASVVPSGAFSAYIFSHKEQVTAYRFKYRLNLSTVRL